MTEQFLGLLFAAMCLSGTGGLLIGLFWRVLKDEERDSTARHPRPGTQPVRPAGLKAYRKSPDMLSDESKKP